MRVGFIAVARPTFDVEAAAAAAEAALTAVRAAGWDVAGDAAPVLDAETASQKARELGPIDRLVLVLASFTDSTLPARVAAEHPDAEIMVWGVPEPRTGQRLRLNSLCGINLACFRLPGLRWLYHAPDAPTAVDAVRGVFAEAPRQTPLPSDADLWSRASEVLAGKRVGVVGDHPDGFEPCGYGASDLNAVGGAIVDDVPLGALFEMARAVSDEAVADATAATGAAVVGLDQLDPDGVEATERIGLGLRALAATRGWHAVATRCWPECFTEFGGAACLAQAELSDDRVPATCEADVFGALTALLLQEHYGSAVLVADLVDADREDGTLAFWHCGIGPRSMAADEVGVTVHPNRKLPLLHEFRLKPGRVMIARLTRAGDDVRLFATGGEVLDRPRPYAGTCGVVRPDLDVDTFLETVLDNRLEHHFALVYT